MAQDAAIFLERGQTWYRGRTPDSNALEATNLEGQEFWHDDIDLSASGQIKVHRSPHKIRTIVVRNMGTPALLPKMTCVFSATANVNRRRVAGMGYLTGQSVAGVVDEFIAAAGCPQYDLCHVVVEGPAMMTTSLAGNAENLIAVGDVLCQLTAATSGATTAGRPVPQDLTGATALLGAQIQNRIAVAMSAKTTGQTNGDVLAYVKVW